MYSNGGAESETRTAAMRRHWVSESMFTAEQAYVLARVFATQLYPPPAPSRTRTAARNQRLHRPFCWDLFGNCSVTADVAVSAEVRS
jgi:hypothetical protein